MPLRDEMLRQGEWLFRWRGLLPLLLILLLVYGFQFAEQVEPEGWHWFDNSIQLVALGVTVLGVVVRALAIATVPKRTSGRVTKGQKAESLNTRGMYSVVRHPLYLGNYLYFLGFCLIAGVWWMAVIYTFIFWLYYERIMLVEEEFLLGKFGEAYREWAARTPAFVPNPLLWSPPEERFSVRMLLRRETTPWLGVGVGFLVIESLLDLFVHRSAPDFDLLWVTLTAVFAFVYAVVKVIKKTTNWLKSPRMARIEETPCEGVSPT